MHATLTAHSEYTVPEKSMHPLPMGVIDVLEGTNIFHVNTRIFNRKFQWGGGGWCQNSKNPMAKRCYGCLPRNNVITDLIEKPMMYLVPSV